MTLQDAMAEVILRAVLESPEKFPKDLVKAADHYKHIVTDKWIMGGDPWPYSRSAWCETLSIYSDILPEILSASV